MTERNGEGMLGRGRSTLSKNDKPKIIIVYLWFTGYGP